MSHLKEIPLNQVRESKVALRPVNRNTEKYLQLVDSIKRVGVMNPISVSESIDPETQETYFAVVDGLHRFTASLDAGRDTIPAKVMPVDETELLGAQIMANIIKIETKPAQYSAQLVKMLALKPLMTITELAGQLSQSTQWVQQRLSLHGLPDPIKELIDSGKVPLTNAYALAKLKDNDEIANFLERAQTLEPEVFVQQVNNRVKELNEARRQGRKARGEEFVPTAHCQAMGDMKKEMETPSEVAMILKAAGLSDPTHLQAARKALEWVLHLDQFSLDKARAEWEAQRAAREENRKKRDKERAEAKVAKAREEASKAEEALVSL